MDNTSKLVLIGGVALSLVVVSRALGKTSPPIPPTALERQVMRHKDLIWRVGVQKDTDPALIAAIIAMESSGISRPARPITVRDYEGREKIDYVVGLMQVRVDTAGQYCHIWTRYDLQPDEVNVNCGAFSTQVVRQSPRKVRYFGHFLVRFSRQDKRDKDTCDVPRRGNQFVHQQRLR